jgi:hypothetical protein
MKLSAEAMGCRKVRIILNLRWMRSIEPTNANDWRE